MNENLDQSSSRGVCPPLSPPLLFSMFFCIGMGLRYILPFEIKGDSFLLQLSVGGILFVSAFSIGAWALWSLHRKGATPEFECSVENLVTNGAYRFSRNPLYVAAIILLIAFGALLNNLWMILLAPGLGFAIYHFVISREERFLETHFEKEYEAYKQRTRRWL